MGKLYKWVSKYIYNYVSEQKLVGTMYVLLAVFCKSLLYISLLMAIHKHIQF
jgi:hypothetical protein